MNFLHSSSMKGLFLLRSNGQQEILLTNVMTENIYHCLDCKFLIRKVKYWETLTSSDSGRVKGDDDVDFHCKITIISSI